MNCIEITYLRRYLREETAMIIGSLREYKRTYLISPTPHGTAASSRVSSNA
jgi:hypothetical protein